MRQIIKIAEDSKRRIKSIVWWNALSDADRIALVDKHKILMLTNFQIEQMFIKESEVKNKPIYTVEQMENILVLLQKYVAAGQYFKADKGIVDLNIKQFIKDNV